MRKDNTMPKLPRYKTLSNLVHAPFGTKVIPQDGSCQAEYADGFILDETEHKDVSQFSKIEMVDGVPTGDNILKDIIYKRPEAEHGPMVRFTVFYKDRRWDIDWRDLPDNARPIRVKHIDRVSRGGVWIGDPLVVKLRFGYQFTDANGKNQQIIQEVE